MVENMNGRSEDFIDFVESIQITDRESAEDYDIDALMQLQDEEAVEAEKIIGRQLLEEDDHRAPRAIRFLNDKRFIPLLDESLNLVTGKTLVEAAYTLWKFTGEQSYSSYVCNVVRLGDELEKAAAIETLQSMEGPEIEDTLFNALNDREKLVRTAAETALFILSGLVEWKKVTGRGAALLGFRMYSTYSAVREPAIEEFKELVKAKREGRTAEELGITMINSGNSVAVNNLIKSYAVPAGKAPWADDYDLDSLDKIEGEEAEWAHYAIITMISRGDFRAVRALVHINSEIAPDVFREAIPSAEGRLLIELVWGLWKLTGDNRNRELLKPYLDSEDERVKARANEVFSELS